MERKFHEELGNLKRDLLDMGSLARAMVGNAVNGLRDRDADLIRKVHEQEQEINRLQLELDDRCFTLSALHQPTASDLRLIIAVIKITSELERVGDTAVNVAEAAEELLQEPPVKPLIDIPRMADIAQTMVHDSLRSLVNGDIELANAVLRTDDEVDQLSDQVANELVSFMLNDPRTISRALQLLLISRFLERIADHATNIAEDVIFIVKGADVRHGAAVGTQGIASREADEQIKQQGQGQR